MRIAILISLESERLTHPCKQNYRQRECIPTRTPVGLKRIIARWDFDITQKLFCFTCAYFVGKYIWITDKDCHSTILNGCRDINEGFSRKMLEGYQEYIKCGKVCDTYLGDLSIHGLGDPTDKFDQNPCKNLNENTRYR
jgi:hypothetical protein